METLSKESMDILTLIEGMAVPVIVLLVVYIIIKLAHKIVDEL